MEGQIERWGSCCGSGSSVVYRVKTYSSIQVHYSVVETFEKVLDKIQTCLPKVTFLHLNCKHERIIMQRVDHVQVLHVFYWKVSDEAGWAMCGTDTSQTWVQLQRPVSFKYNRENTLVGERSWFCVSGDSPQSNHSTRWIPLVSTGLFVIDDVMLYCNMVLFYILIISFKNPLLFCSTIK